MEMEIIKLIAIINIMVKIKYVLIGFTTSRLYSNTQTESADNQDKMIK